VQSPGACPSTIQSSRVKIARAVGHGFTTPMDDKQQAPAQGISGDVLGSPLRNLAFASAFVAAVYILSTAGFVFEGWSVADALYMVTLTIFSVGYGEVHPIDTPGLRLLDMATIVLGCTGMIVLTGALVQTFAHFQIRRLLGVERMQQQISSLSGHTIICGLGRIGRQLAKELAAAGNAFVIIERDAAKLAEAQALGYLCLTADATDEAALREAGIDRARVLATVLPEDALNVFITLSARSLNRKLEIIARGELPATEGKLIHAGADKVVLPTHIGAERIAELILYPQTARYTEDTPAMGELRRQLGDLGLDLEVVDLPAGSPMIGQTVGDAERRGNGGFFIVQIDRANGQSFIQPPRDTRLESRDRVILVLRGDQVSAGGVFSAQAEPIRVGRRWVGPGAVRR